MFKRLLKKLIAWWIGPAPVFDLSAGGGSGAPTPSEKPSTTPEAQQ